MNIRPVNMKDAQAISQMRRRDGVRENVLALSSDRLGVTEKFLDSLTDSDRAFVAEEDGETAAFGVLIRNTEPCRSHCASLAIMTDPYFQERGLGHALMKKLTECADGEMKLHRIELLVLTDNEKAINLYKKFGFMVEATRYHAAVRNGDFANEYLMGRLRGEGAEI